MPRVYIVGLIWKVLGSKVVVLTICEGRFDVIGISTIWTLLAYSFRYNPRDHTLACFGGAAPQHACAIAQSLGIRRAFVHRYGGILSAYGMGLADVTCEFSLPTKAGGEVFEIGRVESGSGGKKDDSDVSWINEKYSAQFGQLEAKAKADLLEQNFTEAGILLERYLHMRYKGTDQGIMIAEPKGAADENGYVAAFKSRFKREYGFDLVGRDIVIDDIRVRGVGKAEILTQKEIPRADAKEAENPPISDRTAMYLQMREGVGDGAAAPADKKNSPTTVGRWVKDVPVYMLPDLKWESRVKGPAIIMNNLSTCVIEPECVATITRYGDIDIALPDRGGLNTKQHRTGEGGTEASNAKPITPADVVVEESSTTAEKIECDPITLSVMANRFMSIAEQCGRTLQRTSVSVNIKERLDFSCAIFDSTGGLVANAPHVPVHLGAMADTVRGQVRHPPSS